MIRIALAATLCLLTAVSIAAQGSNAARAGRILDAAEASPIAFASVVIENAATGQQLTGSLTGEDGRFVIRGLPAGTYKVRISFAGFQPADTDLLVSPLNQNYDLGDVRLPRLDGFKETVTVTGEAVRVQAIDSQVFKLSDGPTQSSGTVLDALKNIPGITVDQEGKGLAARQRSSGSRDRRAAIEPDRFRQPARARQCIRREHRGD